jgi:hypothetical protein
MISKLRANVNPTLIKQNVMSISDKLMEDEEHFPAEFSANKGWFSRVK